LGNIQKALGYDTVMIFQSPVLYTALISSPLILRWSLLFLHQHSWYGILEDAVHFQIL